MAHTSRCLPGPSSQAWSLLPPTCSLYGKPPLNTPKLHTVCVVGAPADVSARIHALLDEQRTRLDARWRIGDYVGAELLLIETDSVYGHMDRLKAQGTDRLVAALTATVVIAFTEAATATAVIITLAETAFALAFKATFTALTTALE